MRNHDPSTGLRFEADLHPSVLWDPRILRDFTRVCEAVGIVDPETGLIRRCQPGPSS
jgi:hypothetical protein